MLDYNMNKNDKKAREKHHKMLSVKVWMIVYKTLI